MRTAWTTLKIAVFAPMPRARVRTAAAEKPGRFRNWRSVWRRECIGEAPWEARRVSVSGVAAEECSTGAGVVFLDDPAVEQVDGAVGVVGGAGIVGDHADGGAFAGKLPER